MKVFNGSSKSNTFKSEVLNTTFQPFCLSKVKSILYIPVSICFFLILYISVSSLKILVCLKEILQLAFSMKTQSMPRKALYHQENHN